MAFKGTEALFTIKEYSHKKTSEAKRVKICWSSLLNQAVKERNFTGIKNRWLCAKRYQKDANLSNKSAHKERYRDCTDIE
jgi:hypothetical protein